jgi:hypothetical protein
MAADKHRIYVADKLSTDTTSKPNMVTPNKLNADTTSKPNVVTPDKLNADTTSKSNMVTPDKFNTDTASRPNLVPPNKLIADTTDKPNMVTPDINLYRHDDYNSPDNIPGKSSTAACCHNLNALVNRVYDYHRDIASASHDSDSNENNNNTEEGDCHATWTNKTNYSMVDCVRCDDPHPTSDLEDRDYMECVH